MLQLSLPFLVSPQAKRPVIRSDFIHEKRPLNLHCLQLPPSLFISNSQQHPYPTLPFPSPATQSVAAIVFGDGSESRLYPLTKRRSEGAIPIAANYRLIDAVVSNCINSNINRIYALTQFNSTCLNSHLSRAYSGIEGLGHEAYVQVIAAYQGGDDKGWFQGNADAVRRCLWLLEEYPVSEFLVLPGNHLYRMDYQKLINAHRKSKADITIAVSSASRNHDPGFGFLQVNSKNQVLEFRLRLEEKPIDFVSVKSSTNFSDIAPNGFPSMGIYLINRQTIKGLLEEHFPTANDFRSEVIPGAISKGMKVQAYVFGGYWEDMKSIEAFYQANMQSTKNANLGYNFHNIESPLYTLPRRLPPTLITDAVITDSVIGGGCIINRCKIKGAVIGMGAKIGEGVIIEDSVIIGSDVYIRGDFQRSGMDIPVGIGKETQIRNAIIDKNARIGKSVMVKNQNQYFISMHCPVIFHFPTLLHVSLQIINKDHVQEGDREADGYVIRGGIVVVTRDAVIPDGSVL
ncbi:inactive glucose-1-phosphate adenylyltransferase small subunit 2, chloroplastic isoform X2 [Ziziphus jujuba]|uniref:Inactive glucose-1-phosphate adenylyltransferase small subunit 2, chloroplastic isoform X2 n=1 Tax=Ziziphus jujuba TaxID=326968 RepID=A0A6P3Z1K0_ZIZJJ|nr:inactive glucose-1-phosphate adenylyltransferase small subunit 2, chloroplastic isoform X2 [Ziziphus jujuba]